MTQVVEFRGKQSQVKPVIQTECNKETHCQIKYTDVEDDLILKTTNTVTLTCMKGQCLNLLKEKDDAINEDEEEDVISDLYAEIEIASLIAY